MKPRHIALVILVLMGVLPFISDDRGNIVANLLQDQLGNYAWLILVPYSVIVGVLIGFELWDRPTRRQDPRLAFDRRNRQAMIEKVRTLITQFLRDSLCHEVLITPDLTKRPKAVAPP
jgi:hypothetical protein